MIRRLCQQILCASTTTKAAKTLDKLLSSIRYPHKLDKILRCRDGSVIFVLLFLEKLILVAKFVSNLTKQGGNFLTIATGAGRLLLLRSLHGPY